MRTPIFKAIVTRWHDCTQTRPARVSASAEGVKRLYITYEFIGAAAAHRQAAEALIARQKWAEDDYYLIEASLPDNATVWVWAPKGGQNA